jgi:hypothetical protein
MVSPDNDVASDSPESARARDARRLDRRFEIVEAVLLALAAVLTAWTAFQSTKWGGVQANSYAQASATRVESSRASTRAGQQTVIDVDTFIAWVDALSAEERADQANGLARDGTYTPNPERESGFFYERFREEFKPAVHAWLAERPLSNPDAPLTPFAMPEYSLAEDQEAARLEREAEAFATEAREANQHGDNYVLMTIMFATVLFFAGISSKMDTFRARVFLLACAVIVFLVATGIVFSFPKEI